MLWWELYSHFLCQGETAWSCLSLSNLLKPDVDWHVFKLGSSSLTEGAPEPSKIVLLGSRTRCSASQSSTERQRSSWFFVIWRQSSAIPQERLPSVRLSARWMRSLVPSRAEELTRRKAHQGLWCHLCKWRGKFNRLSYGWREFPKHVSGGRTLFRDISWYKLLRCFICVICLGLLVPVPSSLSLPR